MVFFNLKKIKLGEMLVKAGNITEEHLKACLEVQIKKGGKIGDILVEHQFIEKETLIKALSEQLNVPVFNLKNFQVKSELVMKLPERIARRYRVILLDFVSGEYCVGMVDPTDVMAYDELTRLLGGSLKIFIVNEDNLLHVLDLVYRRTEDIASFAAALKEEIKSEEEVLDVATIGADAAPVVKLLDSIFTDAVQVGASDIHIEPDEKVLRIRQRVDGVLQEHIIPGTEIVSALVLRIKLIANMNISEKRLPQDGRFAISVKGRTLDVRVAIIPVHFGEAVVLRLLDQAKGVFGFEQLGIKSEMLLKIKKIIHKPNGMILVTGPTGSGKTTTLYAILSELNTQKTKIITIEDPVEYVLPRVNQVQVNSAIDLNFANVLRASVRHDPNVIMVGEMRDEETVHIGLRAAMTGHLVFSTLHTNDAISSTVRLIDMGGEGFLVAGALRGVIAQRLVRKICDACAVPYNPNADEKAWIDGFLLEQQAASFKQGAGCSRCNQTGYRGRTGIYEFLEITIELGDALRTNDTNLFMKRAKEQHGFETLSQSAFDLAAKGVITLEEALKIAGEYF